MTFPGRDRCIARFDQARGNSSHDTPRLNILRHDRARGNDGALADAHAGDYNNIRTKPNIVFKHDPATRMTLKLDRHFRVVENVVARPQNAVGADHDMIADLDVAAETGVDVNVVVERNTVMDDEVSLLRRKKRVPRRLKLGPDRNVLRT